VFVGFALMVFFSYSFMSNIEHKHLLNSVNSVFYDTQTEIDVCFRESANTLNIISESVRNMALRGYNFDSVAQYMSDTFNANKQLMVNVTNIYGVFEAADKKYYASFSPAEDFVLEEQPWYIAANEADGSVGITEPNIDRENNIVSITFARCLYYDNNDLIGIVCMDVRIDKIREYAVNASVTESSYGILFDSNFNVIAHPIPVDVYDGDGNFVRNGYLGGNIRKMNNGEEIVGELIAKGSILERKVFDYNRVESVGFFRKLNNGWYLAIIAYSDKYYKSVREIGFILVLLGFALATVLSVILLYLVDSRKKAEERTQIMLDAMPLAANFWNKDLVNIDCNKEALKLFGLSSKKEYLDNFFSLSPEYQPDGKLSDEKAMELVRKAFDDSFCRVEWMHRKPNGELIPCEVTLVRAKYGKENIVCGYTRDLREMKVIMAKMREADECTQVLFDATPLSCIMIDKNINVVECNQEIVRLFEIANKQEFIDKMFDFYPQYQPNGNESREQIIKYIDEAFEEGSSRFEWVHQKLDGEQIPTEVFFVRVKFRGEYAVAGYIRDLRELKNMIAEMRRAQIAEESSKAKSDFLAKMSHEIRTPMNAILGITEIQLQDSSLSLATKEALERIYNSGDLLLGIINDILDLSKIEAGKLELVPVQYDIASLIHDTVKLNILRYESKPIDFKLKVSENVPSTFFGDELRIKQILNNLLSNAFKYTQEGQVELMLSSEAMIESSNVVLIFRVSDTGQGMTAEQVKKLGDKFSRFNMEANRKTEGTGLGMNITRNLIQLMSGDIFIESTPGMGSAFLVRLPQGCVNSEPIGQELADNLMKLNLKSAAKKRNAQISQDFMPYGRVLVVDDVETNLYVARGLMAPYGISVDTATSGFETLDKIRDGADYDIIFMDHMMPRMDGIEATKLIRSLGYNKPIVALTANALAGQAEMFLNNGFDEFISKPIDIRQLNNILNKLIRDKQPPEVLEEARKQKNNLYAAGGHSIAIDSQLAEFFVRDAEKTVGTLTNICDNNCRRGDDLSTLIINVHAMKSALSNVGESELSNKAAELEQAGRDQNTNIILSSLPEFIKSLNQVIDKLKPNDEDGHDTRIDDDPESLAFLQEKLIAIQAACASLDKKTAKEALAALKQKNWPKHIKDKLSVIAERLLHSEFDEVAAIAREVYFK